MIYEHDEGRSNLNLKCVWKCVFGGSTWRGTGDGSISQPATGRGHYVVRSSDTVAVRDVATPDVVGNDVHRHGTGGVSDSWGRWLISSTTGGTGRQVHDGNGSVAPADGSGWSRTSAGLVLQRLYDLSVLFSGGSAPSVSSVYSSSVTQNGSWNIICGLWCNDVLRNISYLLGACPDYVTCIWDLLFVTVFHRLVSSILRCHVTVLCCCPTSFGHFSLLLQYCIVYYVKYFWFVLS